MKLRFDPTALRRGSWKRQVGRFLWGGTVTVLTGVVAKLLGPRAGGLFLAFPAILPLSLVMLARRENGEVPARRTSDRGRHAAVAAAAGATYGAPALLVFALLSGRALESWSPTLALLGGGAAWGLVASLSFGLRRVLLRRR